MAHHHSPRRPAGIPFVVVQQYEYTVCASNSCVFVCLCTLQVVLLVLIGMLLAHWRASRSSKTVETVRVPDKSDNGGVGLVVLYAVLRVLFGVRWPLWPPLVELCVPAALLALALVALLRRSVLLLLLVRIL